MNLNRAALFHVPLTLFIHLVIDRLPKERDIWLHVHLSALLSHLSLLNPLRLTLTNGL
jgi:hypothetical protein